MTFANVIDLFLIGEAGRAGPLLSSGVKLFHGNDVIAFWDKGTLTLTQGNKHQKIKDELIKARGV